MSEQVVPTYTTRIIDLPDMNVNTNTTSNVSMSNDIGSSSYKPIDPHPNPYGHPPPSVPMIPTPSFTDTNNRPPHLQNNQQEQPYYKEQLERLPQQGLPSRDMPFLNETYTHDEQVHANYVPPIHESARRTSEYIKKYDEATERKIIAHAEMKTKQSRFDAFIEDGQIPLLVAVLFFIFHMPLVNAYIFKNLSFLSIYSNDGSFNIYGLLLKSSLFGGIFYSLSLGIHLLSEM
jgi:hypothetical protein